MISNIFVPYEGPENARIYAVGEAPGSTEEEEGRPFVGNSGQRLRTCFDRHGFSDSNIRFLNLSHFRPQDNKFHHLLGSRQLAAGLEELADTIRAGQPTVIAALGNWPMYYLTGRRGKKAIGTGIGKWRGSILPCSLPGLSHIKVIPTFHPAYIERNRSDHPIFDTDIQRIVSDATFPDFRYPVRRLILDPRDADLDYWTEYLCAAEDLACDIETVKKSTRILCHGFSPSPELSVVISHSETDFHRRSSVDAIYRSRARKTFHNGTTFDEPVLHINGFKIENFYWDTQIAQHVMWAELPKSLEYLTSILTRQPYYKTAGRGEIPDDAKGWDEKFDKNALYEYNGTDTSVTSECQLAQAKEMREGPKEWKKTFEFEMRLAKPITRIGMAGMPIDVERRDMVRRALEVKWAIHQFVLDQMTGYRTNVNSPKVMAKILYDKDKFDLPPRRNKEGNLTTDEDTIVALIGMCKDKLSKLKPGGNANEYWLKRYEALKVILVIRGLRKLLSSYINVKLSEDNCARSIYKLQTETGRLSCAIFFDGTGFNAQTMPREVLELKDYAAIPQLKDVLTFIYGQAEEDKVAHDNSIENDGSGEDTSSFDGVRSEGVLTS